MFNKSSNQKSSASAADTSKKNMPPRTSGSKAQAPSILSRDLLVTGDINTDGDVQIEGRLEGNIKATTLTVGEQGAVNGTIKADTVCIRGKVTGKINAETVELSETANVLADITQDHLTIENGAFFDGKCARRTKPSTVSAKPAPKTT